MFKNKQLFSGFFTNRQKDNEDRSRYFSTDSKIVDIIYLPTTQCSCRCTHCGIKFGRDDNKTPRKDVAKYICESDRIDEFANISITGGEPFIVADLAEFINPVFSRFPHVQIGITTSGTLTQNVKDMLNRIPAEYLQRLGITVSIDGVGDTHNAIRNHCGAYEKALATLRTCAEYGVSYGINMVVHGENIDEIDELSAAVNRISPYYHVNVIPLCTSVSHGEDFPYNDAQIAKISRYINDVFHIKYLCSQGESPAAKCVTGVDNVVVMPNGNMYTCLVGAAYRDNSDDYYLGNITEGFDKAFANNARCFQNIKKCVLCNNPCDINRQKRTQQMSFQLTGKEQARYFALFDESAYYQGFHQLEPHDDGASHRWMAQTAASVTLKTTCTEASFGGGGGIHTLTMGGGRP
ncbi:MAG: radical SAM protein, partial [Treponema sp.]|nr:radical SAM protein [Treponema sp.]